MTNIPILVAFFAGIVSFLSPCILPIIPGFLAYLAGESSSNAARAKPSRCAIFLNSFFFVLGFSIVFAMLGVLLNGVLAHVAYAVQDWLAWIGGTIVIFFGLYLMGFFQIPFLEHDHKMRMPTKIRSRYLTSLLFGFAVRGGMDAVRGSGARRHSRHRRIGAGRSVVSFFHMQSGSAFHSCSSDCSSRKARSSSINIL